MASNNVSEGISKWDKLVDKFFRFVIGGENSLQILLDTYNYSLIKDAANYELTQFAKNNLAEYFSYIDTNIKNLIYHVYHRAGKKELRQIDFVMDMATEMLNSCYEIRDSIKKKSEILFTPDYILYVALGVYAKERARGPDMGILRQMGDKMINLLGEDYAHNPN